jgi:ParB-like chromosome segregation protein Spo0J
MTTPSRLGTPALRRLRVHEYAALFRVFDPDERERLRESLRRGYDDAHPIVITPNGEIVDGRNRRDVAVELELEDVPVVVREFADEKAIVAFVVAENLARRHLSAQERRALAGRLVVNGSSTRQAAKLAGVSQMTAQRAARAQRSGESSDSRAVERVNGSDGKSYPATKPETKIPRSRRRQLDESTQTICPTCGGSGCVTR